MQRDHWPGLAPPGRFQPRPLPLRCHRHAVFHGRLQGTGDARAARQSPTLGGLPMQNGPIVPCQRSPMVAADQERDRQARRGCRRR